jgi:hypothetical protein
LGTRLLHFTCINWGQFNSGAVISASADLGAECPAAPATSTAKLREVSTTSQNIQPKIYMKGVLRHKRYTAVNKNGHELSTKSKKDTKMNSKAKLGYIQKHIETYQVQQEM